jgi:Tol biopolymer transport system component
MYKLVIAIAMGAALMLSAQAGNDPEKQLQAAINKEVVEGDLNGAINLYKKIVADSNGNRSLAAQSLLRLGGCYQKLGQEKAQKTYRQLIADYPEQQQQVAAARQRLEAITKSTGREDTGITIRKLLFEDDADASGSISPDGRFLSYMNGYTGDLAVRDLRTGQSRMLTNKGGWDKSGDFAFWPQWSPDGKQIAYYWFTMANQKKTEQISELRIIDSSGKNSPGHVLYRSNEDDDIIPVGWFPDGKSILAADVKEGISGKIVRVSIDDGKVQVLKEGDSIDRVRLSPDGKYIAYESATGPQSMNNDIFLLPVSGGSEIPLVTGPHDDVLLDWTPDGSHIFFSSNRSGTYDAWLLRLEDGKESGAPQLIKQDFGIVLPIGITQGGDFYFGREVIMHDIFIADWDAETGKLLSTPKNATQQFAGATYWPAWSRNGKKLAYIVHRGALYRWAENQVRIRDIEIGQERTLPIIANRVTSVSWSPDGKSLLLCGQRQAGKFACWIVEENSASVLHEIAVPQGGEQAPMRGAVWAPDGSAVYYSTRGPGGMSSRIVKRNLASNDERILYSLDRFHNPIIPTVSPDGRFLAFTLEALVEDNKVLEPRLMLLPTAGGGARELLRSEPPHLFCARRSRL